ncbi:restriction endonuclease subunit S [Salinisphaera hydrothermalis]|uniref:restriction endonuclease subunit S n=1 Tax=Salinisphaera hydrothermalis TaxID=563188 RepID=UPI00334206D0
MRLSKVCDVRSGYTARGKLDPLVRGGVPALQLRNVSTDGQAPGSRLEKYDLGALSDRYFVRGGDLVFRSRGEPNTAAVVSDALVEPAVVIVPLFIVRPDRERVLPEYLAWAINQPDAQRRLAAEAQGTSLRMIPIAVLKNLDIAVPDLHTQKKIVALDALARHEAHLLRQLAVRREQLVSAVLGKAATATDLERITK